MHILTMGLGLPGRGGVSCRTCFLLTRTMAINPSSTSSLLGCLTPGYFSNSAVPLMWGYTGAGHLFLVQCAVHPTLERTPQYPEAAAEFLLCLPAFPHHTTTLQSLVTFFFGQKPGTDVISSRTSLQWGSWALLSREGGWAWAPLYSWCPQNHETERGQTRRQRWSQLSLMGIKTTVILAPNFHKVS
jgi:hypothetical protein